jgi:Helix-turn-helix domain
MERMEDEKFAAKFFGCSVAMLRRMRREGRGPRFVRVGRLVRYPLEWLTAYAEAHATDGGHRYGSTSPEGSARQVARDTMGSSGGLPVRPHRVGSHRGNQ